MLGVAGSQKDLQQEMGTQSTAEAGIGRLGLAEERPFGTGGLQGRGESPAQQADPGHQQGKARPGEAGLGRAGSLSLTLGLDPSTATY